ncbi:MAG: sulfatase [Planctomycetota bacterium]
MTISKCARHAACWSLTLCGVAEAQAPTPPPNIVLVLADDLGWTDLSTPRTSRGHGSTAYRTPHLDALAAAGMSFDQAYAQPNCAPARAALMSGRHAARTGVYTVGNPNRGRAAARRLEAAPNTVTLAPEFVTLAETLRAAGYATGHFGKWHLGDDPTHGPLAQGFDVNVGGGRSGSPPRGDANGHWSSDTGTWPVPGLEEPAQDQRPGERRFLADRLTTAAIDWMREARPPFFCCLTHFSVHTPIQAPRADRAAFAARAGGRHQNATYAGMLKNLDDNVGRVLRLLETTESPAASARSLIDNTIVVFASDNGGVGGYAEAGIEGARDVTDNAPLRAGKGTLYEGGIRVPLVVRWDRHIAAGEVRSTPVTLLDLYPTLAALAGATPPADLDGVDASAVWLGQVDALPPRDLFWHFPAYLEAHGKRGTWRTTPVSVIRRGNHKLLYFYETRTWQLFDVDVDLGETHDLAAARPALVADLGAALRTWLTATGAALPRSKADGQVVPVPAVAVPTSAPTRRGG